MAKAAPAKPWDVGRRMDRLGWALSDLKEQLTRDTDRLMDVIDAGDRSHDLERVIDRLDEVWWVLIGAGVLEPSAAHELLVDRSDPTAGSKGARAARMT